MLDKIEEIFTNLKERLASPFFSSFIISWFFFNWKAMVGLFWYGPKQIIVVGYKSYFDLIATNVDYKHGLLFPLAVAFAYTFLYPILRNIINAFLSWSNRWGDAWNLRMMRNGSIPVERYLQLKKHYDNRTKALEDVIRSESKYINQIGQLETDLNNLKIEANTSQETVNTLRFENNNLIEDVRKKNNEIAQLIQLNTEKPNPKMEDDAEKEYNRIMGTPAIKEAFFNVLYLIQVGNPLNSIETDIVNYLESHDIIRKSEGRWMFTEFGNKIRKIYADRTISH